MQSHYQIENLVRKRLRAFGISGDHDGCNFHSQKKKIIAGIAKILIHYCAEKKKFSVSQFPQNFKFILKEGGSGKLPKLTYFSLHNVKITMQDD